MAKHNLLYFGLLCIFKPQYFKSIFAAFVTQTTHSESCISDVFIKLLMMCRFSCFLCLLTHLRPARLLIHGSLRLCALLFLSRGYQKKNVRSLYTHNAVSCRKICPLAQETKMLFLSIISHIFNSAYSIMNNN